MSCSSLTSTVRVSQRVSIESADTGCCDDLALLLYIPLLISLSQEIEKCNDGEEDTRYVYIVDFIEFHRIGLPEKLPESGERSRLGHFFQRWAKDAGINDQNVDETVGGGDRINDS